MRILGSRLVVVLFLATATGVPVKTGNAASRTRAGHSNKRQEIIFLQGDISKRNRKEESMALLEKHGRSLTAEGRMVNKTSKGSAYQDTKEYHRSSFEALSANKNEGPMDTGDAAKSDAYEVLNEGSDSAEKSGASTDHENLQHSTESANSDKQVSEAHHGHGAGFHIVSPDTEKLPAADKEETDSPSPSSKYADDNVYGTIESRPVASIGQSSQQPDPDEGHHAITQKYHDNERHNNRNNDDFVPSSVFSVGEQDIMPFLSGPAAAERRIYEASRNQQESLDPRFPVYRPYQFQESPYWPRRFRRPHFRAHHYPPAFLDGHFYPNRDQSEINPFTSQAPLDAYRTNQQSYPGRPYIQGFTDDEGARQQLIQSMFSLPLAQAQTSPLIPAQMDGPRYPIPQGPEVSSPIFQMQPISQQVPVTPFLPQINEPRELMTPTSPQLTASLAQQQSLVAPLPRSRWVDSPGYSRSEVLDNEEEKAHDNDNDSEEDSATNEGREGEDDSYEDRREEYSRERETYHDDEQTREFEEQEAARADYRPQHEPEPDLGPESEPEPEPDLGPEREPEREPEPKPEEDSEEDAVQRSSEPYDNEEERGTEEVTSHEPEPSNLERFEPETDREQPYSSSNTENNFYEERNPSMDTIDERPPESFHSDQVLGRYSDPPEEPHRNMYQRFARIQRPQPKMEVSQMSASQAQFMENKERRDPMEYFGPVSKNTIPRKTKHIKSGLENVLIRLNGKPLEDSADLRSQIIDGRIVPGKGKLIKSKGPVNVKLSHTNDAKHTKIIDIISPQKYKVYNTKSKITKPVPTVTL